MIKAYIYGTPKGFDAYGSDKSFEGYLKGFYITSRRGKRLMVNRRANGETIYSYLHYGLMEYSDIGKDKAGRINSFFGMSLHISGGIYTPDLKRVFDWFDYWFNKILEDGTILKEVSSGYIQYQVSKFANANNIEHLHSNLPNIFSEKSGTLMLDYDESFIDGKSGQIAQLNNEEDDDVILSTFKHYQWVALSPIFKKIEKSSDICIELDFNDLNDRLVEYNKILLPIAINLNASSIDELCKINDAVQENYSSITSYLKAISNSNDNVEEYNKFASLASDYVAVCENITALKLKFSANTDDSGEIGTINEPKTQFCYNCQEHKDLSEFRSAESTKCIACEEIAGQKKIQCVKCGHIKPSTEYSQGNKICKQCESQHPIPSWIKVVACGTFVLVAVMICFLNRSAISDSFNKHKFGTSENPYNENTHDNSGMVDVDTLASYLNNGDIVGASMYIKDKSDKNNHLPFDYSIIEYIWAQINCSQAPQYNDQLDRILKDMVSLTSEIEDRSGITAIISNHQFLCHDKLKLPDKQFGPDIYNSVNTILNGKNSKYNDDWKAFANAKYDNYNNSTPPPATQDYIYLVRLNKQYYIENYEQIKIEEDQIFRGVEQNKFIDFCYGNNVEFMRDTTLFGINPWPENASGPKYQMPKTTRIETNIIGKNTYTFTYNEQQLKITIGTML